MRIRLKITLAMICLLAALFGIGGTAFISMSFDDTYEQEKISAIASYQTTLGTLSMVSQIEEWTNDQSVTQALGRMDAQNLLNMEAYRLTPASSGEDAQGSEAIQNTGDAQDGGVTQSTQSGQSGVQATQDTQTAQTSASLVASFKDIELPMQTDQCKVVNFEANGRNYLQVAGTLSIGDELLYLDAAYDITAIYETRAAQLDIFYKVFAIMLVVCAVLAYIVTWLLTRPLMRLSKASKELARGNLAYRAEVNTGDEIGTLAQDFNTMASQVERGFSSLKSNMAHQDRFMSSFAHELKTPMTAIIGFAEMLRSQSLSPDEQVDAAHYIFSEGKRLESLSLKLLEIMSNDPRSLQMVLVSPAALIQELTQQLQPIYARDGVRLHFKGSGGNFMLEPDLIKSLMINLLDNAKKSMVRKAGGGGVESGGGSRIRSASASGGSRIASGDSSDSAGSTGVTDNSTTTTTNSDVADPTTDTTTTTTNSSSSAGHRTIGTIHVEVNTTRGKCLIQVTDTGKGIPPDALKHLTEAFYRVDKSRAREQGGAGLGLTLCNRIVKLHGGQMRFESQEGVGTKVSVLLPSAHKRAWFGKSDQKRTMTHQKV